MGGQEERRALRGDAVYWEREEDGIEREMRRLKYTKERERHKDTKVKTRGEEVKLKKKKKGR